MVGVGANGFPGYSPQFSDDYTRDSYALYGDLSADVTDAFFLQGAMRYEDYSDFGSEVVGKLASRYTLNEIFGVRGSIGTGFRAPTPGQQGTTNVSTRLPDGFPVATGLFPASGPVAQALGASPLKPETSTNYTIGMTASLPVGSVTVDFYRIDLEDRFNSISTRPVSAEEGTDGYENFLALRDAGVAGADTIGGVFYFTNAFDTRTEGVDIVSNFPIDWANGGTTSLTASLNYNKEEYTSDPGSQNEEDQFDFNNQSRWRGVFSARHNIGPFSIMGRANAYGPSANFNAGEVQEYKTKVLVDVEGNYDFSDSITLTLGGRNIFDQYPPVDRTGDYCCGRVYSSGTPISWQGSYFFGRLRADF
ncbi:MAG: TonB-dependent receptor [Pseudohongiellaceae bacterium]